MKIYSKRKAREAITADFLENTEPDCWWRDPDERHQLEQAVKEFLHFEGNFRSFYASTETGALHIATTVDGCEGDDFNETPCICWRHEGGEVIRTEHLPHAKDAPCRGFEE